MNTPPPTPPSPNKPAAPSAAPAKPPIRLRVHAAAAADHRREWANGVTLILELHGAADPPDLASGQTLRPAAARLASIGHPAAYPPPGPDELVLDLPGAVLIPGLVNAHAHLDLTHIGPRPYDPAGGFMGWARSIIPARATTAEGIRDSVRRGVELSIAGGSAAVGDIDGSAGCGRPGLARGGRGDWRGVAYNELFAFVVRPAAAAVRTADAAVRTMDDAPTAVRPGLGPHAPYSVGHATYLETARVGVERDLPLCTHLGESMEERRFLMMSEGPMRDFLESIEKWDESGLGMMGPAKSPIEYFEPVLKAAPGRWLLAHLNDCASGLIRTLRRQGASVVYCPRASAYFRAAEDFGPHRYREMLDAGVNVCLGTDSIVNLDTPERISVLDEMRLLHERDETDPEVLFAMATVHGARALGLSEDSYRFQPGALLGGLVAVTPGALGESPRRACLAAGASVRTIFVHTGQELCRGGA